VLLLLADEPFAPLLRTHKLKGKLSGVWACSVGYEHRLVFEFIKSAGKEDDILLIEIGTHEEVY
jgi:mRNA-degrading endonuclease YafQ of YafQ-DinJ toxin-antitoxin module